jgi:hypothetical protein
MRDGPAWARERISLSEIKINALTVTPPYLDPRSHQALDEIDMTVLDGSNHSKPQALYQA